MDLGKQSIIVQEALVSVVSSFAVVLQELAVVMTVPSFRNFVTILAGWVFARRRTITGILTASGIAGKRHHSAFHRLFAEASWALDALGLAVFRVLEPLLPPRPSLWQSTIPWPVSVG